MNRNCRMKMPESWYFEAEEKTVKCEECGSEIPSREAYMGIDGDKAFFVCTDCYKKINDKVGDFG